jgi:uncharacterized protein DUF3310
MDMQNKEDVVNHPSHYTQYHGFEVIDVCEQLRAPDESGNFNRGNAFKYLARAGWKNPDKHVEDLEKAEFYIRREIERIKKGMATEDDLFTAAIRSMRSVPVNDPEPWTRCPECNLVLKTDGSCVDGHVLSTLNGDQVWGPSIVTATVAEKMEDAEHCPECGIVLASGAVCPNRHGWMRKVGADHIWISHSGGKWNGQKAPVPKLFANIANPRCPECDYDLIPDPAVEGLFYCEQGHGRMKITPAADAA